MALSTKQQKEIQKFTQKNPDMQPFVSAIIPVISAFKELETVNQTEHQVISDSVRQLADEIRETKNFVAKRKPVQIDNTKYIDRTQYVDKSKTVEVVKETGGIKEAQVKSIVNNRVETELSERLSTNNTLVEKTVLEKLKTVVTKAESKLEKGFKKRIDNLEDRLEKRTNPMLLRTYGGGGGTAENIGNSGVGIFKNKVGENFNFKKISAGSSKIQIVDDTDNDVVTVDVDETELSFSEVVDDTTPQLGGDLDTNGNSIVTTSNGDITLAPDGTGKVFVDTSAVGIHVQSSSTGATASTSADEVVVEREGNSGITILSSDTTQGSLYFGSSTDVVAAQVNWQPNSDLFTIGTHHAGASVSIQSDNQVEAINIDSNQLVAFKGTVNFDTDFQTTNGSLIYTHSLHRLDFYERDELSNLATRIDNTNFGGAWSLYRNGTEQVRMWATATYEFNMQNISSHDFKVHGSSDNVLVVDAGLNHVGVNTDSPDRAFHVLDSGAIIRLETSAASGQAFIEFQDATARKAFVGFGGSTENFTLKNEESGGGLILDTNGGDLILRTSGSNALYIDDTNSNVGIGTSAPSKTLSVDGDMELHGGSNIMLDIESNSSLTYIDIDNQNTGTTAIRFIDTGSGRWIIGNDGADGDNFRITATSSFSDAFTHFVIDRSNGDVGIGTISPDTKLDVNGAITIRELSSDPSDPDEGSAALWQSDGTGSGDDGDIMMKITAGGATKTVTLVDFSAA